MVLLSVSLGFFFVKSFYSRLNKFGSEYSKIFHDHFVQRQSYIANIGSDKFLKISKNLFVKLVKILDKIYKYRGVMKNTPACPDPYKI